MVYPSLRQRLPRPRVHSGTVLLGEDGAGRLALQETRRVTINHHASPGHFETCCFFILGYPAKELLQIINQVVIIVMLTICYACAKYIAIYHLILSQTVSYKVDGSIL